MERVMIYTFIPWREDKSLYTAYDECLSLLNDEDYAALCDHDTCFTTNDWMDVIETGIEYTNGVFFTGYTNRVACPWQIAEGNPGGDDYSEHRKFGLTFRPEIKDRTREDPLSGFIIIVQKKWWEMIKPFIMVRKGCLGVDNEMHDLTRIMGQKVWQLPIYMYHYYRGGTNDKSHLL